MKYQRSLPLFIVIMILVTLAGAPTAAVSAQTAANNGMVDVWAFVDADQNGIYSTGDDGLSDVTACLARADWESCVGTDYGDTWWEDLEAGNYVSSIDAASIPTGYELLTIRCEPTGSREEYTGCQYDLLNLTATFSLLSDTRINIFFALTPIATVEEPLPDRSGYVDIWAFVDADQNGIYSTGDDGLSDVTACLARADWESCVGTDYGDTWWEDLEPDAYSGSIDPASLPAGYELLSIRCEHTISREEYAGCQYDLEQMAVTINLLTQTRINIFFALTPTETFEEIQPVDLPDNLFIFLPFLHR